jgi:hypothetical protein
VLRFAEMPKVDVVLIESGAKPGGMGGLPRLPRLPQRLRWPMPWPI